MRPKASTSNTLEVIIFDLYYYREAEKSSRILTHICSLPTPPEAGHMPRNATRTKTP